MPDPTWHTPATAQSSLGVTVTEAGLAIAREELLNRKGLALALAAPPSLSFAAAVVYQALANKQSASASPTDDTGTGDIRVRFYPFEKRIMAMCIIPDVDPDDATVDHGYVRSLIG